MRRIAVTLLVVVTLLISSTTALAAVHTTPTTDPQEARDGATTRSLAQQNHTNNSSVSVGVGRQLSTVVVEADSDVRTEYEESTFEARVGNASGDARAVVIAERTQTLVQRARTIRTDYRVATSAYEDGEITRTTYAQYLATLNARAENLQESIDSLRERAEGVSALDLRAAGYSEAELRRADRTLDVLTGAGIAELRQRFTARSTGDIDLDRDEDGLSVSVSNDAGDVTREVERSRDADPSFTVSQSRALEAARTALGAPGIGSWSLYAARIDREAGSYDFTFVLTGTNATGAAKVAVDGSTGTVYSLESEVDVPGGDDAEEGGDGDAEEGGDGDAEDGATDGDDGSSDVLREATGDLTVLVTEGRLSTGTEATLTVLDDGTRVTGATVTVNGQQVGTTDGDGTITITVPDDDATVRATTGTTSGSLALDAGEDEDEELYENLHATATTSNGDVTVSVTYDGEGVDGATVLVNGQQMGTTEADGSVTVDAPASGDFDARVVKGDFSATFTFTDQGGDYALADTTVGADDSDDGDAEVDDGESEETEDGDGGVVVGDDAEGDSTDSTDGDSGSTDGDTADGTGDTTDDTSDGTTDDTDSSTADGSNDVETNDTVEADETG